MHMKAPAVPPAATALFEAAQGPRVLPGTYTVKMTKGDNVYTEQLNVASDPRAKFSLDDRKAQFELSMKIYHTIEHMTYAVGRPLRAFATAPTRGRPNCRRRMR